MLKGLEACLSKLMKHYAKSNWVYCAVLILDPRFKVESFYKSSWGREMVKESLEKFESIYKTTYYKPKVKAYSLIYIVLSYLLIVDNNITIIFWKTLSKLNKVKMNIF